MSADEDRPVEDASEPERSDPSRPDATGTPASGDFPAEGPGGGVEEVNIDPDTPQDVVDKVIKVERQFVRVGQLVGVLCVLLGVLLIALGSSGTVSWDVTGGGISSKLQTNVVGIVLVVAGVVIFIVARPKINIMRGSGRRR